MTYLPLLGSSVYNLNPKDPQPGLWQEEHMLVLLSLQSLNAQSLLYHAVLQYIIGEACFGCF